MENRRKAIAIIVVFVFLYFTIPYIRNITSVNAASITDIRLKTQQDAISYLEGDETLGNFKTFTTARIGVDTTVIQARVIGNCTNGISSISEDGLAVCSTGTNSLNLSDTLYWTIGSGFGEGNNSILYWEIGS